LKGLEGNRVMRGGEETILPDTTNFRERSPKRRGSSRGDAFMVRLMGGCGKTYLHGEKSNPGAADNSM